MEGFRLKLRVRTGLTVAFLLSCLTVLPGTAAEAPPPLPAAPTNLDFEQGQPGEAPPGWKVPVFSAENGYTAKVAAEKPEGGRQAVRLALEGERKDPQAFGNLMTSFDATAYRGKRIRFRAAVRAQVPGPRDRVGLWLRVDRESGEMGFFDNMADRPITSADWKRYEIVGDVAPDAKSISVGLLLAGAGEAWIDSASIEAIGEAGAGIEPARPLTPRGLDNLVAFTRLLGYVRFFHPSDQAAAADWDKLALAGVQAAEKAAGPEELARSLEGFFRPLAPTVRVYPTSGPRPATPAELAPAVGDAEAVYWEHTGVKLGDKPSIHDSRRVGTRPAAPAEGGGIIQELDAAPYRGKRLVLRASARAEVSGSNRAELRLITYRRGGGAPIPPGKAEITSGDWQSYEAAVDVPADAAGLAVVLGLASEGRVFWDDFSLESPGVPSRLMNGGFEEGDGLFGWDLAGSDKRAGYQVAASDDHPKSGDRSLLLSWSKPDRPGAPSPGEPLAVDLGGGVSALVPIALYKDGQGTLPHVGSEVKPPSPEKPEGFKPTGDDRATRLADVALAWNVFQHFYPYFDVVQSDWPAELRKALTTAATDKDGQAFVGTLRRMVAALKDGHGNAYQTAQGEVGHLPLLWDWVEDQLVVTRISEEAGGLRPGDVILTLDGKPARDVLMAEEETSSGATEQWRRWRTLQRMLIGNRKADTKGSQGDSVRIEARHLDGETVTATLSKSLQAWGPGSLVEDRPEKIAEVRPGIFYVDIDRINDEDFEGAVDRLAAAKGIVFDLRGYPGNLSTVVLAHLTDKPVKSAHWTVPIVSRPDRQGWEWDFSDWSVQPKAPRFKAKVAFLTDGRAISYAETYMGIVESYKLAEIVGSPTAGTNGNINPFSLPGGYGAVWTGMRVLKHDGSQHHGIGIQPTVPVSRTVKGVAAGRDELLEKAIEVVER
jgi:C-terminal processing protease CtpA/Prc